MNFITPIYDEAELDEEAREHLTEETFDNMLDFFSRASVSQGITMMISQAIIDDVMVEDYQAAIVAKFYINKDLHMTTADGYTVNVDEMVRALKEMARRALDEEVARLVEGT